MMLQFLITISPFCLSILLQLIGWKKRAFIVFILAMFCSCFFVIYLIKSFINAWKDEWANGMTRAMIDGIAVLLSMIGGVIFAILLRIV